MSDFVLISCEDVGVVFCFWLVGFVCLLCDSGYKVGFVEIWDVFDLMWFGVVMWLYKLKQVFRVLFCGCFLDWFKFDELFDVYWIGKGVKLGIKVFGISFKKSMKMIWELIDV